MSILVAFAVLALAKSSMEDCIILGAPLVIGVILFSIPFLSNSGERHFARRPWAVIALTSACLFIGGFWVVSMKMAWTPNFHPGVLTAKEIGVNDDPAVARGAKVFQEKACINCHLIDGVGGLKGPDLTFAGDRLTRDQIVIRIKR